MLRDGNSNSDGWAFWLAAAPSFFPRVRDREQIGDGRLAFGRCQRGPLSANRRPCAASSRPSHHIHRLRRLTILVSNSFLPRPAKAMRYDCRRSCSNYRGEKREQKRRRRDRMCFDAESGILRQAAQPELGAAGCRLIKARGQGRCKLKVRRCTVVEIYSGLTSGAVARTRSVIECVYLELMTRDRFGIVGYEGRTRDRRPRRHDQHCGTQPAQKGSHRTTSAAKSSGNVLSRMRGSI